MGVLIAPTLLSFIWLAIMGGTALQVLIAVFFITSADSATFVIAMLTSEGNLEPPASLKIIWGVRKFFVKRAHRMGVQRLPFSGAIFRG